MAKAAPAKIADLLMAFWRKVGESKQTPTQWEKDILTPIHKTGNEENPKNHRPICMLSHQRKIVEAAVAENVGK